MCHTAGMFAVSCGIAHDGLAWVPLGGMFDVFESCHMYVYVYLYIYPYDYLTHEGHSVAVLVALTPTLTLNLNLTEKEQRKELHECTR